MALEPVDIHFPQSQLDDLQRRLENIRWPARPDGYGWTRGTEHAALRDIVHYWKTDFSWRQQEKSLNQFAHYRSQIAGNDIHFIHETGKGPAPLPLILTHGWPDSFTRYQKVIPMLADPARYGGDPQDAFHVVVPSVPGFGLSRGQPTAGINNAAVARLWHSLMTDVLGYNTFGAGGGDIGSGVTRCLAMAYPEALMGIHLTDIGIIRPLLMAAPDGLTAEEAQYAAAVREWIQNEGAYMSLQATKPQTLFWALNDSPVGLASWILEKFMAWGDCQGRLVNGFSYDELLTNITLYWLTGTAGSAANIYYENMHGLPPVDTGNVPVGMAQFAADILPPAQTLGRKTPEYHPLG
ncbi:epoxide hydrolase family protein [Acerihabitans sp. KWT182]|uniref:Epoxide hydrolase family protein n=1 Tax=Acerihabitans sp. KWT182 TaxID=3157919 RepID=A0AAU7Q542_9GAMM